MHKNIKEILISEEQIIEKCKELGKIIDKDYEGKEVVGQDIADELKLVQFVDGKSTTNTIKRIQENEKCNN